MGANCDSILNNNISLEKLERVLSKDIEIEDKSISIKYNLLKEINEVKERSKYRKEILKISKKHKIISGFIPLSQKKEILVKWIKILFNFENYEDYVNNNRQIFTNATFLKNLQNSFLNQKKPFLKLVSQGLPTHLRQFIWTIIIDTDENNISNVSNNEKEKMDFRTLISLKKNENDIEQIEKDIYRTFFSEKDNTKENIFLLKELLIALNNLDDKIGYCQGINFIVAFILKVTNFNKIKAFHLSRLILRKINGYFRKDFPLLNHNLKKFNKCLKTLFPKLSSHLKKNDLVDEIWIGKWIQTLLTINLPFKEACYIWDSLLVYGFDFIIPISLSILYFTQKKLLELKDSSDIITFLQETLNPSLKNINNIIYKDNININNYVIPIHEIISYAKKIRNQFNLGPGDGNEYALRNLIDRRVSFNRLYLKDSFNDYETKMKKINEEKNSNDQSHKSNLSKISTDDLSSNIKNNNTNKLNFTINYKTNYNSNIYNININNDMKKVKNKLLYIGNNVEEKKINDKKDIKINKSTKINNLKSTHIYNNKNNYIYSYNNSKTINKPNNNSFNNINYNNNNNYRFSTKINRDMDSKLLLQPLETTFNKTSTINSSFNHLKITDERLKKYIYMKNKSKNSLNNFCQKYKNLNYLYKNNLKYLNKSNNVHSYRPTDILYNPYRNNNIINFNININNSIDNFNLNHNAVFYNQNLSSALLTLNSNYLITEGI